MVPKCCVLFPWFRNSVLFTQFITIIIIIIIIKILILLLLLLLLLLSREVSEDFTFAVAGLHLYS